MVIFQSYRQNYKRVYITIPIYRQRLQPISETHTLESTILNLKYKRVGCRMILFPLKITSPKIALPHFWSPQKFESSHLHPPNSPPSSEANISPAGHTGPGRAVRPVPLPTGSKWVDPQMYIYIYYTYIYMFMPLKKSHYHSIIGSIWSIMCPMNMVSPCAMNPTPSA